MGSVRLGIDIKKVLELRDQYSLRCFVETGTWRGGSCTLAAQHFSSVITIEADRGWYDRTRTRYQDTYPNLHFWFGDSRTELARALEAMGEPCLIWADAHWNGGGAKQAHEMGDECPLAEELQAINASFFSSKHVILIDDARLFIAPPPYPHDPAQWPTYADIRALLAPRQITIHDDVIYGEPA